MPIYEAECRACGRRYEWYVALPVEDTNKCTYCGGDGDRVFSRYAPKFFSPFVTRNIMPDGSPVEVKSQSQLSSLCNEYKLVHVDDPKHEPKPFTPLSPHEILGTKDMPEARLGVDEGVACSQDKLPA